MTEEVLARGEGIGLTVVEWARALLCNSLGRYEDAQTAARQASTDRRELGMSGWALVELSKRRRGPGTPRSAPAPSSGCRSQLPQAERTGGLGITAPRALVSGGEVAERHFQEAIERLGRTRIPRACPRPPRLRRVAAP